MSHRSKEEHVMKEGRKGFEKRNRRVLVTR
jgi:hypothetical protein